VFFNYYYLFGTTLSLPGFLVDSWGTQGIPPGMGRVRNGYLSDKWLEHLFPIILQDSSRNTWGREDKDLLLKGH